jgi:hypothetical protein
VEDAATKDAVKTILGQRGLLLVATHGMNNPQSTLHGLLLLRSGNGNDDVITAEEIFGTTVGTELVVLSACYSGWLNPGSGLMNWHSAGFGKTVAKCEKIRKMGDYSAVFRQNRRFVPTHALCRRAINPVLDKSLLFFFRYGNCNVCPSFRQIK